MFFISHRGNISKKNKELENRPDYINSALAKNYDVEVDIWFSNNNFYLGHDGPGYLVNLDFLKKKGLWLHAKNIESLNMLVKYNFNCFWHQNDDVTLTSKGFLWTYPGKKLLDRSICVLPEIHNIIDFTSCVGICSDYIEKYKKNENKTYNF